MLNGTPMDEELASDWIVRLDDAMHALDPTLGVIDFEERLMPARFDDGEPVERYDQLAARLFVDEPGAGAVLRGETYREPDALARAWMAMLREGPRTA